MDRLNLRTTILAGPLVRPDMERQIRDWATRQNYEFVIEDTWGIIGHVYTLRIYNIHPRHIVEVSRNVDSFLIWMRLQSTHNASYANR